MRKKNRVATVALRDFGEKRIARFTRRSFDRHLLFLCQRTNICRAAFKIDLIFRSEFLHKTRVGITRSSAQLMVQMADDQFLVTETDQPVQQRDGIASAGDADQIARIGWKPWQQFGFYLNPIHSGTASNVQTNYEQSTNDRQSGNSAAS